VVSGLPAPGRIAAHVRLNPNEPRLRRDPEMALRHISSERRRLALPYGPAAEALGICRAGPPPPGELP
jgi:hypothetical protein